MHGSAEINNWIQLLVSALPCISGLVVVKPRPHNHSVDILPNKFCVVCHLVVLNTNFTSSWY